MTYREILDLILYTFIAIAIICMMLGCFEIGRDYERMNSQPKGFQLCPVCKTQPPDIFIVGDRISYRCIGNLEITDGIVEAVG